MPSLRNIVVPLVGALSALLLSSCASMSGEGSYQTTLIRTNPPGASIYVDGRKVGQTPEFVDIRRSLHPVIEMDTAKGREEFELPTKYRWSQSFSRNLIFYIYAPIGWLIDIATGTAWDVRSSQAIPVQLSAQDLGHPKSRHVPPEVVIAPPRSPSIVMSDAAGHALEARLRETADTPGAVLRIRSYDQSLAQFLGAGYEYQTMSEGARQRLLRDLNADYLYESTASANEGRGWILKSDVRNIYEASVSPGPTLKLNREGGEHTWWSRLFPNTLGVDFVNETMQIELNTQNYDMAPVHGDEWWAQGIKYVGAINVLSLPDRRREFGSRWEFSPVPALRFSRRLLKITGLPATGGGFVEKDPQFERWSISGGYGLEAGYLFGRHYIYFDLVPLFNWSEISWRQNAEDKTATRTTITVMVEIGYTCVFDSNWFFRFFSRSQAENTELWKDALTSRLGDGYAPTQAKGVVSGLTVGYRFDFDRYKAEADRDLKKAR